MNKDSLTALVVLFGAIVGAAIWVNTLHVGIGDIESSIRRSSNEIEIIEGQIKSAAAGAAVALKEHEPLQRFHDAWEPHLDISANPSEILMSLQNMADASGLLAFDKRTSDAILRFPESKSFAVQQVAFSVSGNLADALEWLAAVEKEFPAALVSPLHLRSEDFVPVLSVNLQFPRL